MPASASDVPASVQNPNNYLKSLVVSNGVLEPGFVLGDDGSKTYKVTVENNVTNILISATAVSSAANVSGDGSKDLDVGTKTFTIKVTAENGNVRDYKIEVTRKDAGAVSASAKKAKQAGNNMPQKTDGRPEEAGDTKPEDTQDKKTE